MAIPDRSDTTSAMELNRIQPAARPYEQVFISFLDRFLNIPVDEIRAVWDPDTCPASHLPWLAWTFGVDEWDPNWDEATKRAVIKASPEVHRHKGTRYALDRAVSALQLKMSVEEWFEYGGQPYRFKINIDMTDSDRTWGPNDLKYVVNTALKVKNVRSHLEDVQLQRKLRGPADLKIGAFINAITTITIEPPVLDHLNLPRPYVWTAARVVTERVITITPRS